MKITALNYERFSDITYDRAIQILINSPDIPEWKIKKIPGNSFPEVIGQRGGYFTKGGARINYPSAYKKSGFSNMIYRTDSREIIVGEDFVPPLFRTEKINGDTHYILIGKRIYYKKCFAEPYFLKIRNCSYTSGIIVKLPDNSTVHSVYSGVRLKTDNFFIFDRKYFSESFKNAIKEVIKLRIKQIRNDRVENFEIEKVLDCLVTREDSIKAGNCVPLTDSFINNKLRKKFGERDSLTVQELLSVRDDFYTRRIVKYISSKN